MKERTVTGRMKKRKDEFYDDSFETFEEDERTAEDSREQDSEFDDQTETRGARSQKRASRSRRTNPSRKNAASEKESVRLTPEQRQKNSARFHAVMQYVFLGLGAFLFLCLFLNLLCNFGNKLENPAKHWMGYVGYGISYALHGLFGFPALFLPVGMVVFFAFWKRLREERRLAFKLLNAVALLLLLSTIVHTFYLAFAFHSKTYLSGGELISKGAALRGGGFLGGMFAYLAVRFLNWVGAFVLEFILFFASFFC